MKFTPSTAVAFDQSRAVALVAVVGHSAGDAIQVHHQEVPVVPAVPEGQEVQEGQGEVQAAAVEAAAVEAAVEAAEAVVAEAEAVEAAAFQDHPEAVVVAVALQAAEAVVALQAAEAVVALQAEAVVALQAAEAAEDPAVAAGQDRHPTPSNNSNH